MLSTAPSPSTGMPISYTSTEEFCNFFMASPDCDAIEKKREYIKILNEQFTPMQRALVLFQAVARLCRDIIDYIATSCLEVNATLLAYTIRNAIESKQDAVQTALFNAYHLKLDDWSKEIILQAAVQANYSSTIERILEDRPKFSADFSARMINYLLCSPDSTHFSLKIFDLYKDQMQRHYEDIFQRALFFRRYPLIDLFLEDCSLEISPAEFARQLERMTGQQRSFPFNRPWQSSPKLDEETQFLIERLLKNPRPMDTERLTKVFEWCIESGQQRIAQLILESDRPLRTYNLPELHGKRLAFACRVYDLENILLFLNCSSPINPEDIESTRKWVDKEYKYLSNQLENPELLEKELQYNEPPLNHFENFKEFRLKQLALLSEIQKAFDLHVN